MGIKEGESLTLDNVFLQCCVNWQQPLPHFYAFFFFAVYSAVSILYWHSWTHYQHHLDPGQKTPSIILEVSLLISFCPNFTHFTRRPFVAKIVKMVGNCPILFFVIILTHSLQSLQSSRVNDSCLKWQFKIGSKLNIVCANKTRAFF